VRVEFDDRVTDGHAGVRPVRIKDRNPASAGVQRERSEKWNR
jgi:hypothetical protein